MHKVFRLEDILEIYNYYSSPRNEINESNTRGVNRDDDNILIYGENRRAFLEDLNIDENEVNEEIIKRIKRFQKIINVIKAKNNYKCQICGYTFLMDNGKKYCEAHHIKMLSQGGSQNVDNVIILCSNHHRMFHYGGENIEIKKVNNKKMIIKIEDKEYEVKINSL